MANASKIVSDCQQALGKGDVAAARKLVHDNLLFQGPIDTFHSPEPYFEALKKLHPIISANRYEKDFRRWQRCMRPVRHGDQDTCRDCICLRMVQGQGREDCRDSHRLRCAAIRRHVRGKGCDVKQTIRQNLEHRPSWPSSSASKSSINLSMQSFRRSLMLPTSPNG